MHSPDKRHEVPLRGGEALGVVHGVELAHELGQAVAGDGDQHLLPPGVPALASDQIVSGDIVTILKDILV